MIRLFEKSIVVNFEPKQLSSDAFIEPLIAFDDRSNAATFGYDVQRFVGNVVNGPREPLINELTVNWVTPDWSVVSSSSGIWVRLGVELQTTLKVILSVSVQLHDGVPEHKLVTTVDWTTLHSSN